MIRASDLRWLAQAWLPARLGGRRFLVLGEYNALGRLRYVLADVALRAGLARSPHVAGDPHTTAINIGRQDLAREILALAGCDPRAIEDLIERKPTETER